MRTAILLLLPALSLFSGTAAGRVWTDASGRYTLEATLVAYDGTQVILARDSDGELGSVDIDRLSESDREYLTTKEAEVKGAAINGAEQLWKLESGLQVPGRVVDYVSREVVFERKRGKVYVNDRVFGNLPKVYQRVAPKIVGHYEQNKVHDEQSLKSWLVSRKGAPQSYRVEGVILELDNGDEYALPFFLFSASDLAVLQPGWEDWLATHGDHMRRRDESFELQSLAAAYQQNAAADRRIAELQLGMQAVTAGVTSLWEVTLYPPGGAYGQPQWVVVPGRDSRTAQQAALAQHPGYVLGPVRKVSN